MTLHHRQDLELCFVKRDVHAHTKEARQEASSCAISVAGLRASEWFSPIAQPGRTCDFDDPGLCAKLRHINVVEQYGKPPAGSSGIL